MSGVLLIGAIKGADLFGVIAALLVSIYLVYALLRGERF